MTNGLPPSQTLLDVAADAVSRARAAGADAAEAEVSFGHSLSLIVRLGALEDVDQSEGQDLSLRLFVGQRSASVSASDLSPDALNALVERAIAMARIAPENPWTGLAPQDMLATGDLPDLDLFDHGAAPEPAALLAMACAAEDAARAVPGVTNSEGGSASSSRSARAHVTSHGFSGTSSATSFSVSATVIAGEGSMMQRDYDYHSARHRADLEAADAIGHSAGIRAVARLDPGRMTSGAMPVLYDPRVAGSLLSHAISAMSGAAIAKKRSFLRDRAGTRLFREDISLHDNPHRLRGLRSHGFDAEGLPTRPSALIAAGVLGPWLCDAASARQLGLRPTGHASSGGVTTGNLALDPGTISRAELMADIKHGVLVTELIGQGVDMLTGDYSRGASGWRIIDGEIAGPVSGFTIAGNLLAMFADLRCADDVKRRYSTHVPTLRTDAMMVAGD